MSDAHLDERVVYHDSCYLGRHNDILSPRKVIGSLGGIEIVEAGRNGTKGMCCAPAAPACGWRRRRARR